MKNPLTYLRGAWALIILRRATSYSALFYIKKSKANLAQISCKGGRKSTGRERRERNRCARFEQKSLMIEETQSSRQRICSFQICAIKFGSSFVWSPRVNTICQYSSLPQLMGSRLSPSSGISLSSVMENNFRR
jgi:hypothetical protein